MNNYAPIVLFTYNRPWHTQQVLDALSQNEEAKNSILYVFCDGAKEGANTDDLLNIEAVRSLIKAENRFKDIIVKIQEKNKGLANSIIEGVTEVVNIHGKVVVLEDDIVTSKFFLKYMNDALLFYQDNERVMHISGYMYPHKEELPQTFFFNVPLCWGWATWSRSWNHFDNDSLRLWNELNNKNLFQWLDKFGSDYLSSQLAHNISGLLKTWFIKWHASVLLQDGYTVYPGKSLVDNIGFDNTGVHNGESTKFKNVLVAEEVVINPIAFVENEKAAEIIKLFYREIAFVPVIKQNVKFNFKKSVKYKIRATFYKVFPELKKPLQTETKSYRYNSYVGKECKIYPEARLSNSIIGSYSYIAENSIINNTIIGKFCSIGPNLISGWGIHPIEGISTHPMFYSTRKQNGMTLSVSDKIDELLPIHIGNDVFIGMNVTILDGVKIGDGAIIGAGAVVSKNIPSYAIAVGNPIKIIKYRFNDIIIEKLQKIKWWDFEIDELILVEKHFFDINEFIKILESRNNK